MLGAPTSANPFYFDSCRLPGTTNVESREMTAFPAVLPYYVTGGPEGARAGRLTCMVGGEPEALELQCVAMQCVSMRGRPRHSGLHR